MKLIRFGNKIINAAHIIDAEFQPFREWTDEESGEPTQSRAQLVLLFAVTKSEIKTDYSGDLLGIEQNPYVRKLFDSDACNVWAELSEIARIQSKLPAIEECNAPGSGNPGQWR
jgi:hypothetical protein